MENIKSRMQQLLHSMNEGVFERQELIALAMLSALSGESIFLLGLPGVGKSMIARRLKMAFRGASSFEYLMSRFSTPDEIFGPVSITKLKDEDTYERVVEGYLPTADIVFLDEIWKAGPAIQNSLLTALNEKIFHNGSHDIKLPLKAVISASNELPAEGEGLEALWDRFLIRYVVEPIHNRIAFVRLITEQQEDCEIADELTISSLELETIKQGALTVNVPEVVCNIICDIRETLTNAQLTKIAIPASEPPYISDRRWRKVMGILRTSAYLNGRQSINISDCMLLEHLLWDNNEQLMAVRRMVAEAIVGRVGSDVARSIRVDEMEGVAFTEPVSELITTDDGCFIFTAADEEILIKKEDYESLGSEVVFGNMTADNRLVISKQGGPFTVKAPIYGSIVLNAFTYKLKRQTPLRTGSTSTITKSLNTNANILEEKVHEQIENNIFLRPYAAYKELQHAFDTIRFKTSDFKKSPQVHQ